MSRTHSQRMREKRSWQRKESKKRNNEKLRNKLYGRKWKEARLNYLSSSSSCLCCYCKQQGRTRAAEVIDHIIPWSWGRSQEEQIELFWCVDNWQGLCSLCHDSIKRKQEREWQDKGYSIDYLLRELGIEL